MLLIHAESQCYLQNFSFVISLSPKATNTMQSRICLVYVKRPFSFLCYYCLKRDRISHLKFWGPHMSSAKRSWRSWGGDATKKSVKNPSGLHCVLRCCPHKHNWVRNFLLTKSQIDSKPLIHLVPFFYLYLTFKDWSFIFLIKHFSILCICSPLKNAYGVSCDQFRISLFICDLKTDTWAFSFSLWVGKWGWGVGSGAVPF